MNNDRPCSPLTKVEQLPLPSASTTNQTSQPLTSPPNPITHSLSSPHSLPTSYASNDCTPVFCWDADVYILMGVWGDVENINGDGGAMVAEVLGEGGGEVEAEGYRVERGL